MSDKKSPSPAGPVSELPVPGTPHATYHDRPATPPYSIPPASPWLRTPSQPLSELDAKQILSESIFHHCTKILNGFRSPELEQGVDTVADETGKLMHVPFLQVRFGPLEPGLHADDIRCALNEASADAGFEFEGHDLTIEHSSRAEDPKGTLYAKVSLYDSSSRIDELHHAIRQALPDLRCALQEQLNPRAASQGNYRQ